MGKKRQGSLRFLDISSRVGSGQDRPSKVRGLKLQPRQVSHENSQCHASIRISSPYRFNFWIFFGLEGQWAHTQLCSGMTSVSVVSFLLQYLGTELQSSAPCPELNPDLPNAKQVLGLLSSFSSADTIRRCWNRAKFWNLHGGMEMEGMKQISRKVAGNYMWSWEETEFSWVELSVPMRRSRWRCPGWGQRVLEVLICKK